MTRRARFILLLLFVIAMIAWVLTPAPLVALARYWLWPDYPRFAAGAPVRLPGLTNTVHVDQYPDGRYRIAAQSESDLYRVQGFLHARDRLFQMDLFRHIAQGRLAELVGSVPFGPSTTLDADRFNRFMGFTDQARQALADLAPAEKNQLEAFTAGVNAWIATGQRSLEHRLLQAEVEPWKPEDSLAVLRAFLFRLTHNYTREVRRLLIACDAGLNAMERIWPTGIEFGTVFLPPEDIPKKRYPPPPAVVPEMREALPGLCARGQAAPAQSRATAPLRATAALLPASLRAVASAFVWAPAAIAGGTYLLSAELEASNNWAVSGSRTRSASPILANDPHLPHMIPPIVWGVHQVLPERQLVGFTLPGFPTIVFGHNFHVAWGATVNNVDLQDVYVEKLAPRGDAPEQLDASSYLYDGAIRRFEVRKERFLVRGSQPVTGTARYSVHGPVLNDLDPFLRDRIPIATLRVIPVGGAGDGLAIEAVAQARSGADFVDAIGHFDTACESWLFADAEGMIGFVSPCRVPVREGWAGTFPVPGWLSRYEWRGLVPKEKLPRSFNPARGWLATSNNRALPRDRYPTAYNNDPSPPSRYLRVAATLSSIHDATIADMARLQLDTRLPYWPRVRSEILRSLCTRPERRESKAQRAARQSLCSWDGDLRPDSVAATIYTLFLHALLDRALAEELSGGARGELWAYLQAIPHTETNVDWLWERSADDPVWDDVHTAAVEDREATIAAALTDAVALGAERYGGDIKTWQWGKVRPFQIRHPLAGGSFLLGKLLNTRRFPGRGAPETVFKNQFLRSDREEMHPAAGPVFRVVIDMANPAAATFSLAGGQSGWPRSPHYGDLMEEWLENRMRPLTPQKGEQRWPRVEFVPKSPAA